MFFWKKIHFAGYFEAHFRAHFEAAITPWSGTKCSDTSLGKFFHQFDSSKYSSADEQLITTSIKQHTIQPNLLLKEYF